MKPLQVLKNGILDENPVFRLVLGMCPTLAVTTAAVNGIGMGFATTFVLVSSNIVIALLRKFIPDKVRIPAFITVIATFVTIVGMLMQAFVPDLFKSLGLFIPLIVVNCIILQRAEAFASRHNVGLAALDGIGMGLGFTLSLTILGSIRELLGAGTVFGLQVMPDSFSPAVIMILPPGAFITLGLLMFILNLISMRKKREA